MLSAKKQQLEEIIGANDFSNIESLTSDEDILPSLVMTLNQKNDKKHSLSFVESECFFMGIYLFLGGIGETNLSHKAVYFRHESIVGVLDFGEAGFQQGVLLGELPILLLDLRNLVSQRFVAGLQGLVAVVEFHNLVPELLFGHTFDFGYLTKAFGNANANHVVVIAQRA